MEFFDWTALRTYAGSVAAVGILTQITKNIPGIVKIPTQVWSYILSLIIMLLATYFGGELTLSSGVLAVVNAAIVSLAANGGFEAISKVASTEEM